MKRSTSTAESHLTRPERTFVVAAVVMLGTLISLIALTFWVVLRFDPEARSVHGDDDGDRCTTS